MSSEISIQKVLLIANGNLNYQTPSKDSSFKADMATAFGPTPGAITVTAAGVDADLTKLPSLGGLCEIVNTDSTNFVSYGPKSLGVFTPWGELLPGESYVFRLSRFLLTGMTGTASIQTFHLQADTASCVVQVKAFAK